MINPGMNDSTESNPNPLLRCVICGNPVTTCLFKTIREVEYGTQWYGSACACNKCGLIHQVPMPTEQEALAQYPEKYIHYNPYLIGLKGKLMKLYMRRTTTLLKRLGARPGDALLDIGCGAGEKLAILRDSLHLKVTGIEPALQAAKKAKDIFGLEVISDFFQPAYFKPASFDFIRINHVIEHVTDPVKLLDHIFILLKPGGWLIGETENCNCLSYKIFRKYWALLHFPYHLILFNKQTLALAFKKSEFGTTSINDIYDPTAWSLSFQNFIRKKKPATKRPSSRLPGYTLLTICCYLLTWLERPWSEGAVVEFKSIKPNR